MVAALVAAIMPFLSFPFPTMMRNWHNMLALALLARDPVLRRKVLGPDRERDEIGAVKVVAFTGRESNYPFGVWGALAEQLGKKSDWIRVPA
jgi:hypothetical protein